MTTADIHWKFDEGFTELMYKITIFPSKSGNVQVDSALYCAAAGSEAPADEPAIVFFTTQENVHINANSNVVVTQGKVTMDDFDVNGTFCDDKRPCMFDQKCGGVMINNMASLYQAIKTGSVYMDVMWFDEDVELGDVRGQMFV